VARQLLRGGLVFDANLGFVPRDVVIEGETIAELAAQPAPLASFEQVHDVSGCRVVPGFVDLHFHGARGLDVMEADAAGLDEICSYQARNGTTSFLAT
jgi:N-acetylglucosamine-6-phosphate deacetylase